MILILTLLYAVTLWMFLKRKKSGYALTGGMMLFVNVSLGILAGFPLILLKVGVSDDSGLIAIMSVVYFFTYMYIAARINSENSKPN